MDEKKRFEDEFQEMDFDDFAFYQAFPDELQKKLQVKVEDATAKAPEDVRAGVQGFADELYAAIGAMSAQEKESAPVPEVWERFVANHGQNITDGLADLGSLTGASVADEKAKENAETRMDEILEKMENVAANFQSGAQYFQDEKARLAERERKISETMGKIVTSVTSLQKELGREDIPDERKKQVANLLKQSYEMLDAFRLARSEILSGREKESPRKVAEAVENLYDSLNRIQNRFSSAVARAKQAVRQKTDRILDHVVRRASSFVRGANDAFGKVVRAGVNFYSKGRGVEQWIEGFSQAYDGNRAEKLADRYLMKALAEKPYSRLGVYEIMERSMARDGISAEERQSVFRDLVQQATKAASQKERDAVPEKEAPALVR